MHEAWIKREAHGIAIRAAAQSKNGTEPDELLGTAIEELQTLRRTMLSSSGKTRPIEFRSPAQLRSYKINPELVLAGDFHIMRNDWFVIGGAPCVGKSRAAVALAVAGATGGTWFNLPIHRQFKTMIVQNENAQHRLSTELRDIECQELDDRLLISLQPEGGINFANKNFRAALRDDIAAFKPDVVILDPWNAVTKDEKAESYLSSFQDIRSVIPPGENSPAVGIVAHTRKPRADERTSGRGLLNLLAGSYVLGSVPRTVFAIQAASDDPEDARVVWTCCKNNNGPLGARSAWFRLSGLFAPCEDFDWEAFEHPEKGRAGISRADVREIFNGGKTSLPRNDAAKKLQEASGFSRSTCYNALELDGRFSGNLVLKKGDLSWRD
ncbi:MAG: AAA family ATPase [Chthoniobacterales bacterium]